MYVTDQTVLMVLMDLMHFPIHQMSQQGQIVQMVGLN